MYLFLSMWAKSNQMLCTRMAYINNNANEKVGRGEYTVYIIWNFISFQFHDFFQSADKNKTKLN